MIVHGTARYRGSVLLALAVLGGCATYEPRPLDASASEAVFRARTLDDPALRAYLDATLPQSLPPPPLHTVDLPVLTLVAFYFHPDIAMARTRLAVAEAAVVTAGGRPNPRLGIAPGYETPDTPFIVSVNLSVPIETAGKRGHRIAQATELANAARFGVEETAWQVRSRVRAAMVDEVLAAGRLDLLRAEEQLWAAAAGLLDARLAAGEVARVELTAARVELERVTLAVHTAEAALDERRVALAQAVGLPATALDGVEIVWPDLDQPPAAPALTAAAVQRAGLLNRLDVQRMLAEYAAAEAALRLEVAKQYPDIQAAPAYNFDEGVNKFELGVSVELPILNQNQGPIAEAEARRREVAARFAALQAQVIGDTDSALARYRGARGALTVATDIVAALEAQVAFRRMAVAQGETDRLTLVSTQVERAMAQRDQLDALATAQAALGALEDTVQRPLSDEPELPPLPEPDESVAEEARAREVSQ